MILAQRGEKREIKGNEGMKTAFLDRDGTINRDYPDVEWKGKTEPELIDGAMEGLRFLQDQGYALIMITNQYLIDEGIITFADSSAGYFLLPAPPRCRLPLL